ncbi:hypothetical protein [Streptomyces erythrochromogenes]|uniref:hypothetical protein n=1 Tax=Streptomyces erythrochromogenes TaxID=285574 RepID=UPI00386C9E40|nr:hypothetical protein OG364_02635 [Streptomyces erythrochromogenes]
MSSANQATEPEQQQEEPYHGSSGTGSLVLGAIAVGVFGCPFLPEALPPVVRYLPLYLVLPLGICAVVWGLPDLWRAWGTEYSSPVRARIGVLLGTLAILAPLVWLFFYLGAG